MVFSAAVTAGHCICGRSLKEIEENKGDEYKCLEGESTNQITDHNIIRVTAESMEYDTDQGRSFFPESAFVKFDDTRRFEYYDVGVLKSGENFFYEANLADPMVGSICLPSTELDFSEELITTVGWGVRYSELPVAKNERDRNPTHTSCATSEASPTHLSSAAPFFFETRYKRCDVAFLKENGWGCKKMTSLDDSDQAPPSYPAEKCYDFWLQAEDVIKSLEMNDPEKYNGYFQIFSNIKKIEVQEQSDCLGYIIECFRPDLLFEYGWCSIEGIDGDIGWGMCDTSCQFAPVRIIYKVD